MRLYLVRHGETAHNASGRTQGSLNIPLNETGREQAHKLSERLQGEKIDAFYSSTLDRAYETALIVAAPHHKDVTKMPELCELNYGTMEGILHKDLNDFRAQKTVAFADLQFPGGEHYQDAHARARTFLSHIRQRAAETVLVISHGSFMRVLLSEIMGETVETMYERIPRQKNTAVTLIDFDSTGRPNVVLTADAQHLEV